MPPGFAPLVPAPFASPAHAVTESQLVDQATTLKADYQALEARFLADTDSHAVLLADRSVLEARRVQLIADRATLPGGCGCSTLDARIADINAISGAIGVVIDGWGGSQ